MKKKICLVGGEDVSARFPILRKLEAKGLQVEIAGSQDEAPFKKEKVPYSFYPLFREFAPYKDYQATRALKEILKEENYDLVQSFDTKPGLLLPFAASRQKQTKVVRTVTGVGRIFTSDSLKNRIFRTVFNFLQRRIKDKIDMTIFQNQDDHDYFIEKGLLSPSKATIIKSSGIDLATYNQETINLTEKEALRAELNLDPTQKTIIIVSRLVRQKGILDFMEAAKICKEQGKNYNFLLVGPFDTKKDSITKEEVDRYKGAVQYLGRRSDIQKLLSLSDIFVLPTFYREGVPRVLLEAAAMGLGIVTTDMPGCNDVVENDWNGYLVPTKSADQLAEKIILLAEDDEKLQLFGERNKEKVKAFSLDIVVNEYFNVYHKLLIK